MTDTARKLTGAAPISLRDFVKLHAAEFRRGDTDKGASLSFPSLSATP